MTNPHSALLLDVHARLLRTNGSSFAYLSARAQFDEELPWISVGRPVGNLATDLQEFGATLRPISSRNDPVASGNLQHYPALTWETRTLTPSIAAVRNDGCQVPEDATMPPGSSTTILLRPAGGWVTLEPHEQEAGLEDADISA